MPDPGSAAKGNIGLTFIEAGFITLIPGPSLSPRGQIHAQGSCVQRDPDPSRAVPGSKSFLRFPAHFIFCRHLVSTLPFQFIYPLLPVMAIPSINCRWKTAKRMIIGRIAISEPAIRVG